MGRFVAVSVDMPELCCTSNQRKWENKNIELIEIVVGNFMPWVPVGSGAWLFPQANLGLLLLLSLILLKSNRSLRNLLGYSFINSCISSCWTEVWIYVSDSVVFLILIFNSSAEPSLHCFFVFRILKWPLSKMFLSLLFYGFVKNFT